MTYSSCAVAEIEHIFLDNGGVLTDNSRRSVLYRRLVGEYFAPRYGGTTAFWERANLNTFLPAWERFLQRVENWSEDRDLTQALWLYHADWLRFLFAAAGVEAPDDDDECAAIGQAAERWINPQIVTLFPGVMETVVALASRHRLFTASDGFSSSLSQTLAPIASVFECLYGPDLVNVPKSSGRRYYDAIFAHAGIDPFCALILDDNLSNVRAACEAGARAILVSQDASEHDGLTIAMLTELPEILGTL